MSFNRKMLLSKVKKGGVDPYGEYDVLIKVNNLSSSSNFRIPVYGYGGTNYSWTFSVDGGAEYVLSGNRSATPITINLTGAGEHTIAIRGSDFRCLGNGGDEDVWGEAINRRGDSNGGATYSVKTFDSFNLFLDNEISSLTGGNDIGYGMFMGADGLTSVDMSFDIPNNMVVGNNFMKGAFKEADSTLHTVNIRPMKGLISAGTEFFRYAVMTPPTGAEVVSSYKFSTPDLVSAGNHCFGGILGGINSTGMISSSIYAPLLVGNNYTFSGSFCNVDGESIDTLNIDISIGSTSTHTIREKTFQYLDVETFNFNVSSPSETLNNFLSYVFVPAQSNPSFSWYKAPPTSIKELNVQISLPNLREVGADFVRSMPGYDWGYSDTVESFSIDIDIPKLNSVGEYFLGDLGRGLSNLTEVTFDPSEFMRNIKNAGSNFLYGLFSNSGKGSVRLDLEINLDSLEVCYHLAGSIMNHSNKSSDGVGVYGDISLYIPNLRNVTQVFLYCLSLYNLDKDSVSNVSVSLNARDLLSGGLFGTSFTNSKINNFNLNVRTPSYFNKPNNFLANLFSLSKIKNISFDMLWGLSDSSNIFSSAFSAMESNYLESFKGKIYLPYSSDLSGMFSGSFKNQESLVDATIDLFVGVDSLSGKIGINNLFNSTFEGCISLKKPNITINNLYDNEDFVKAEDYTWKGMFKSTDSLETLNDNFPKPSLGVLGINSRKGGYLNNMFDYSGITGLPESFVLETNSNWISQTGQYSQSFNDCWNLSHGTVPLYFARDGSNGTFGGSTIAKPLDTATNNPEEGETVYVNKASHEHEIPEVEHIDARKGKIVYTSGGDVVVGTGLSFRNGYHFDDDYNTNVLGNVSGFNIVDYHGLILLGNGILLLNSDLDDMKFIDKINGEAIISGSYAGEYSLDNTYIGHHLFYIDTIGGSYLVSIIWNPEAPGSISTTINHISLLGLSNSKISTYKALIAINNTSGGYGYSDLALVSICDDGDLRLEFIAPISGLNASFGSSINTSNLDKDFAGVSGYFIYNGLRRIYPNGSSGGNPYFIDGKGGNIAVNYIDGVFGVNYFGGGPSIPPPHRRLGVMYGGISIGYHILPYNGGSELFGIDTSMRGYSYGESFNTRSMMPIDPACYFSYDASGKILSYFHTHSTISEKKGVSCDNILFAFSYKSNSL